MNNQIQYGGIEGGGTKFICAIGRGPSEIVDEIRFPTTTPQETLEKVCNFFAPFVREGQIKFIGLGSFGPVDVDPESRTYGYITTTPKPNWANTDILGILKENLGFPSPWIWMWRLQQWANSYGVPTRASIHLCISR